MAAASQVFASHGYRGGSFQDVANVVGMSQTSLLHYFPTKRDLLLAVLEYRDTKLVNESGVPLDEGIVCEVLAQSEYNVGVPGLIELYTVLASESISPDHPGHAYFVARFGNLRAGYAEGFRALASEGRLRPGVDPDVAAASLVALWDGLQLQWLMAPGEVDVPAALRAYFDQVLTPTP
ncbi:TetR family transcriptional regulator [Frondihabitans sucicola]|uniref:TetR family transcriptional regulator n=1 Tax=Frondihabitans sucicola TaxID=1268041 RepID=A0ABN6Y2K9_9MICO|nr:TetR family transcriptional regulator [Frondihabitans sucicola]